MMSRKQAVLEGEPPPSSRGRLHADAPSSGEPSSCAPCEPLPLRHRGTLKRRSRDSPSRAVPQIVSTRLRGPDREFPEHDICVFLFIFPAQGPAYGRSVRGK